MVPIKSNDMCGDIRYESTGPMFDTIHCTFCMSAAVSAESEKAKQADELRRTIRAVHGRSITSLWIAAHRSRLVSGLGLFAAHCTAQGRCNDAREVRAQAREIALQPPHLRPSNAATRTASATKSASVTGISSPPSLLRSTAVSSQTSTCTIAAFFVWP
jgi:hypothetical protein